MNTNSANQQRFPEKNNPLQLSNSYDEENRVKQSFLATVNHEIRTPVTTIISLCDFLEEEHELNGLPKNWTTALENIRTNALKLNRIVEDMITMANLDAGQEKAGISLFDLRGLVIEVLDLCRPAAAKKNVEISFSYNLDEPQIASDKEKLRTILFNLIDNALKYGQKNPVSLFVSKDIGDDGAEWVTISVTDSGMGMTPLQLKNLYDPFEQGDMTTTRKFQGLGLGLSICKSYCELIGAKLDVQSELDKGSSFTLSLPHS